MRDQLQSTGACSHHISHIGAFTARGAGSGSGSATRTAGIRLFASWGHHTCAQFLQEAPGWSEGTNVWGPYRQ
jgi:hypothetical protein